MGDPDKIEYIIRQALCLDNSHIEPVPKPNPTKPKHSINYKLNQRKDIAYVENDLAGSRSLPAKELNNDQFGDPPIQAMTDFLLGNAKSWQQLNDLLGSNNPKRLRIMTDDAHLTMLPWQRLRDHVSQQPLLQSDWSIEVSPILEKTDHLDFSAAAAISNPLIVMPMEAGKEIATSANRNLVQQHIHEYLGIVGNITSTTTAYGIQQALKIDPPDFIYIYAPAHNGLIQLDIDPAAPDFPQQLSLQQLAEWLKESSHRPVLILHLFDKQELEEYPQTLVNQCSLLWLQQQARKPEQMVKCFLDVLEALPHANKGDITQLISKQNPEFTLDCLPPHIWISNNTPVIVDNSEAGLSLGRLRAALLRVALGREDLKDRLFGKINLGSNFNNKTCFCFAVSGDKTACPHVFPAQLRQQLQWKDEDNELPVTNFDIRLRMSVDASPREMIREIHEANDDYILQNIDNIADMLEARHKVRNQRTVIMFNWYIELEQLQEDQFEEWIKALLRVIQQEFIQAVPENAVMLCMFCIQTQDEEKAEEAQEIADDVVINSDINNMRGIAINIPLGRIKRLELNQFFAKSDRWYAGLKLDQADIDPRKYAEWIDQHTQGHFENTVIKLWQQYKHDYQEYLNS